MSFERIVVRKKKSVAGITVDAILRENHTTSIRISENPVEFGVDVTDHAVVEPKDISLLIAVSDTPVGLQAFQEIVDNVSSVLGSSTSDHQHRSVTAYKAFRDLAEAREVVTVKTRFDTYDNMLITGISFERTKDSSRIFVANISFRELRIINTKTILVDNNRYVASQFNNPNTAAKATSANDTGKKFPTETSNKTWLKSIADFVRN